MKNPMYQKIGLAAGLMFFVFSGSAFSKTPHPAVLNEVIQKVTETKKSGSRPVVVYDLDDTLLSAQERTLRILRSFAQQESIRKEFPAYSSLIVGLKLSQVHYDLGKTLVSAGINNRIFVQKAKSYWAEHFFTDEWSAEDVLVSGAPEYVRKVSEAGAYIVYLTGRDEARMGKGTRSSLKKNGFETSDERSKLIMKPDKNVDDLEFKEVAAKEISKLGKVVAVFENEPANLNALMAAYPQALGIFVDTIHSPKPDQPNPKSHWIKNYNY